MQLGMNPSDFKPMSSIGPGVFEIRIHIEGEWRVLYVTKMVRAIFVLHVFQKKTQRTAKRDLDLAAKRLRILKS